VVIAVVFSIHVPPPAFVVVPIVGAGVLANVSSVAADVTVVTEFGAVVAPGRVAVLSPPPHEENTRASVKTKAISIFFIIIPVSLLRKDAPSLSQTL
jgi:hypothetical protein